MVSDRKNITQPVDWWAAFEVAATKEGSNLSEWVGACCAANLTKRKQRELSERTSAGSPKRNEGS